MKYIKTFEKLDRKIKKGDYAIIDFKTTNPGVTEFFQNNISKIIEVRGIWIKFGYKYVPEEIKEYFYKSRVYYIYQIELNLEDVYSYAISKEKLELELSTKKFNI